MKTTDRFNPEELGVPYNEIAKLNAIIDMKTHDTEKRKKEASKVYNDLQDFFRSEFKRIYLTAVISFDDIRKILDELKEIFIEAEAYEKCSQIEEWKMKLSEMEQRAKCENF